MYSKNVNCYIIIIYFVLNLHAGSSENKSWDLVMVGLQLVWGGALLSHLALTRHNSGLAFLRSCFVWDLKIQRKKGLEFARDLPSRLLFFGPDVSAFPYKRFVLLHLIQQWFSQHFQQFRIFQAIPRQDQANRALWSGKFHGYNWMCGLVWPGWEHEDRRSSVSTPSTFPHLSQLFDWRFASQFQLPGLLGQVGRRCGQEFFSGFVSMCVWLCHGKYQSPATVVQLVAFQIRSMSCCLCSMPSTPNGPHFGNESREASSVQSLVF